MNKDLLKVVLFLSFFVSVVFLVVSLKPVKYFFIEPSKEAIKEVPLEYLFKYKPIRYLFPRGFNGFIKVKTSKKDIFAYITPKETNKKYYVIKKADLKEPYLTLCLLNKNGANNKNLKEFSIIEGTQIYENTENTSQYLIPMNTIFPSKYLCLNIYNTKNKQEDKKILEEYIAYVKNTSKYSTDIAEDFLIDLDEKAKNKPKTEPDKSNTTTRSKTTVTIIDNTQKKTEQSKGTKNTNLQKYTYCRNVVLYDEYSAPYKCYTKTDYDSLNNAISSFGKNYAQYSYNNAVYEMYKEAYKECETDGCRDLYADSRDEAKEKKEKYERLYKEDLNTIKNIVSRGVFKPAPY